MVETVLLIVLLLVPVIWLVGALGRVHRAALAATSAAREAGVLTAGSVDPDSAALSTTQAVARAFQDQGLPADDIRVESDAPVLWERGATVTLAVSYPVTIVALPFLDRDPHVWVRATHTVEIDPYRSRDDATG